MRLFCSSFSRAFAGLVVLLCAGCLGYEVETHELAASEEAAVVSDTVLRIVGKQSGKCIGVGGGSTADGVPAQIQTCSGSPFQAWRATRDAVGYHTLRNVGSGTCLDVTRRARTRGTNIQLYRCTGRDNQKWNLASQGKGVHALFSKSSGLVLDVFNFGVANGSRIVQWDWLAGDNQKWTLVEDGVDGFAATASEGLTTTTGGGAMSPSLVRSCEELVAALADEAPRVIELAEGSTLDCRTAPRSTRACELDCGTSDPGKRFWRVPVGDQTCADLGGGRLVTRSVNERRVFANSHKTLRGAGAGATVLGLSLLIWGEANVIVQNLTFADVNPMLIEAGDAITIEDAHHVWIDRCRFRMISDGYLDIRGSQAVTVSRNHLAGENPFVCGGRHPYVSLVADSVVTYHHNHFDHTSGRNPKINGPSQVHAFNNLYRNVSYFCLSAGHDTLALVENNAYIDSRFPHWSEGGTIEAHGNRYDGSSALQSQKRDATGRAFAPDYAYTLDPTAVVIENGAQGAGPHAL